jgi:hypothetical protein
MSPKQTSFLAVAVTAYCAGILGGVTMTPEVVSQIIVGVAALVVATVVVCILWLTAWFRALSPKRQQSAIWIAASCASAVVCFLPLALRFLRL